MAMAMAMAIGRPSVGRRHMVLALAAAEQQRTMLAFVICLHARYVAIAELTKKSLLLDLQVYYTQA